MQAEAFGTSAKWHAPPWPAVLSFAAAVFSVLFPRNDVVNPISGVQRLCIPPQTD